MNTTGIVQEVSTKDVKTRFGVKNTYSMKVDNVWYKTGFKRPTCNVGDSVSFDYTEGQYGKDIDLNSLKTTANNTPPAMPASVVAVPVTGRPPASTGYGSKGVFPIPALDGQRAIVRQNAVTNARELVCHFMSDDTTSVADMNNKIAEVIRVARKLEAYSCGDTDLEEVLKEQTPSA